jgi:hypothetical protein
LSHLLPRFDVLSVNRLILYAVYVSLDVRLTNAGRAFVLAILATSYSVVCLPSIGNSSCEWSALRIVLGIGSFRLSMTSFLIVNLLQLIRWCHSGHSSSSRSLTRASPCMMFSLDLAGVLSRVLPFLFPRCSGVLCIPSMTLPTYPVPNSYPFSPFLGSSSIISDVIPHPLPLAFPDDANYQAASGSF